MATGLQGPEEVPCSTRLLGPQEVPSFSDSDASLSLEVILRTLGPILRILKFPDTVG